jgi:hypothetical protein
MKTLKQFEKANQTKDLDEFLSAGDEIDEQMYYHIGCGYMAPVYDNGTIMQGGDPCDSKDGVYTYMTVSQVNDKYYYLGELPEFKTKPDED